MYSVLIFPPWLRKQEVRRLPGGNNTNTLKQFPMCASSGEMLTSCRACLLAWCLPYLSFLNPIAKGISETRRSHLMKKSHYLWREIITASNDGTPSTRWCGAQDLEKDHATAYPETCNCISGRLLSNRAPPAECLCLGEKEKLYSSLERWMHANFVTIQRMKLLVESTDNIIVHGMF